MLINYDINDINLKITKYIIYKTLYKINKEMYLLKFINNIIILHIKVNILLLNN